MNGTTVGWIVLAAALVAGLVGCTPVVLTTVVGDGCYARRTGEAAGAGGATGPVQGALQGFSDVGCLSADEREEQ